MTFYQELQLNQAGSKAYVSSFKKPKEKFVHILTFIFKVLLNLAFSGAVITLFTILFGPANSLAGLVVLFGITTFRFTDVDIDAKQSVGVIYLIFAILAIGPKVANLVPVGCDLPVHFISIFFIVLLSCHNVNWFNHSVLILGYLLLYGTDVSGMDYLYRVICLVIGATLTALILYRNKRKTQYKSTFKNLFTDFSLSDARSRWQIKIAFCVAGAVFLSSLMGFIKPIWAGIAAMSVTLPKTEFPRVHSRIRANVIGCIIMIAAFFILPESFIGYFGYLGGFMAGFCGKYEGQTAWNSFSALSIAVSSFGLRKAIEFRVINNVLGALFALLFGMIIEQILLALNNLIIKRKQKKTEN